MVAPAFVVVAIFAFANELRHGVGALQILFLLAVLLVGYGVFSLAAKMLFEKFVVEGEEVAFIDKFGRNTARLAIGISKVRAHVDGAGRTFYTIGEGEDEVYFSSKLSGHDELARLLDSDFETPTPAQDPDPSSS